MPMLGKMGWKLITNPDALVSCILKAKYYPQGNFLNSTVGLLGGASSLLKLLFKMVIDG